MSQENSKNTYVTETFYDIIISQDNIINIFREAMQYINEAIKCDFITVLLNDEINRYFSILPTLNTLSVYKDEDITIYYSETSITDILRTKKSIYRTDLSAKGNLTPGDLKFLAEGIASDLSLPIIYNNTVKLIVNLCSYEKDAFTPEKVEALEEIVSLLSLALHRVYLTDEVASLKSKVEHWHQRYQKMLSGLHVPVAVLSSDARLIYETNSAFEALSGYTSDELHGMDLYRLHPGFEVDDILKKTKTGNVYKKSTLQFVNCDGVELQVAARFLQISNSYESGILAIYGELQGQEDHEEITQELTLGGFGLGEDILSASTDLGVVLPELMDQLGEQGGAVYILLHLVNQDTGEAELSYVRHLPESANEDRLIEQLKEGPYAGVLDKGKHLIISDAYKHAYSESWLNNAKKLGYRALVSMPLRPHSHYTGILTLLYDDVHEFNATEISGLKSATHFLALIVENLQTNRKLTELQLQNSLTNEFLSSVSSTSTIEDILFLAVRSIRKLIEFDYFSAKLFDNSAEDAELKTIISKTFSELIRCPDWDGIDDSDLGWCDLPEMNNRPDEDKQSWPYHLKSTMNTLLFVRNTYIGTFTISSLDPGKYNGQTRVSFEQFANQVATILHNVKLENDNQLAMRHLSLLKELSAKDTYQDDSDKIFQIIIELIRQISDVTACNIQMVKDGALADQVYSSDNVNKNREMMDFQENKCFPVIIEKKTALYLDDLKNTSAVLTESGKFKSYYGVLIKLSQQNIAFISVYSEVSMTELTRDVISVIANYTSVVLENQTLRNRTSIHSNDLQKTSEELERFIYTISHYLKPNIVSIQGLSSLILKDVDNVQGKENAAYLGKIVSSARDIEKLIEDLLELTRINRVANKYEIVAINGVIADAAGELKYLYDSGNIKLTIQESMPEIRCDRKRILTVFYNLLDNAARYIGRKNKKPQVEVGCRDGGDHFLFYVRDNGSGISKEYHQIIFDLFQDVPHEDETEDRGHGIGLTIVERIIENHGGKIRVESSPGTGSTFYIELPKIDSSEP